MINASNCKRIFGIIYLDDKRVGMATGIDFWQRIRISTSRFVSNSFSDVVRSLCEDSRYPTTLDWGCFIQVSIFLV